MNTAPSRLRGAIVTSLIVFIVFAQPSAALVVTEVMYHPVEVGATPEGDENLEFIELYNDRAIPEDITGYAFTSGINYTFPAGTTIGAKKYLVVARDPAALEATYAITGVYGPFDPNRPGDPPGKLNNNGERIELSNENGAVIISFEFHDGRPWPAAADGAGHSLVLAKLVGDPEEASSWAASTYIGGTPGAMDPMHFKAAPPPPPPPPTLVPIIDLGRTGRYFKGSVEPSPGEGGAPTIAWTATSFDDSGWLQGPSGYGYSTDSAEMVYVKTELTDMRYSYYSVYARLRFDVTAQQMAAWEGLLARVRYDDGFVLYLNGTRVGDSGNVAGNPPAYNQNASTANDYQALDIDLTGYMNLLEEGTNVLSVQAHNCNITGSSDGFVCPFLYGVIPGEPDPDPDPQPDPNDIPKERLLINELLTNSDLPPGKDWAEIYNPGPVRVWLGDCYLSDGRFELLGYKLPDMWLEPGQFWAVYQGTPPSGFEFGLGFAGETLFLTQAAPGPEPQARRVLDAVRFGVVEADVTLGRYPDGDDDIVALSARTFQAPNAQPLVRDIVINEIMYHHASDDPAYDHIELYNRSVSPAPLAGWTFTDGIEYEFPAGTYIGGHDYVVVANKPEVMGQVYANLIQGVNLFGPYKGGLDDHSERVQLSLPSSEIDSTTGKPYMITADEVTYYDGGRWPSWADGQGASLELIDPDSNNGSPDAWAASDESAKSAWEHIVFTVDNTDGNYSHLDVGVFDMMLLNCGEVLIDDLEVMVDSDGAGAGVAVNVTPAGDFESGDAGWNTLGNHVQSHTTAAYKHNGSRSMHVVATGHGDPGANRINQSIGPIRAGTVTFSAWVKWLKGTQYLLMRTSNELQPVQPPWPSHAFRLSMPMNLGTPGQQNTAYAANRGPDIDYVRHAPTLPQVNEPITVTAQVADNDGVASVKLYYRTDTEASLTETAMTDLGSGSDDVAGDGIYTGRIPGAAIAGTMREFYIEASDGSVSTLFPTRLPDTLAENLRQRTCLVRVGDLQLDDPQFATYRIWMSKAVVDEITSRPSLSNELLDCTFVYNDTEVFYNTRIRHRGSPWLRSGSNRPPRPGDTRGFRIDFNSDQKFRDREEINLDGTEGNGRGPLQERASYWFYRKMGLQYSSQEYVWPIMNGYTHPTYEDVQKVDGEYIDSWFPKDNDGYIHKIDDYFEYSIAGTSHSNLDEGLIYNSTHPLIPETYRWGFEKRSHRQNDEWGHLLHFAEMMNTPAGDADYEKNIESVIDPEHFCMVLAIRHAVGDWDSYGFNRGKNNVFYYADEEQKWYLLPWDIDFTLGSGTGTGESIFNVAGHFPEVRAFLNYPKYKRMYYRAFLNLMNGPWKTSYGTNDPPTEFDVFLDNAANARIAEGMGDQAFIDRWNGIKAYVSGRRSGVLGQIPGNNFEITTNGGLDLCAPEGQMLIQGVGPLDLAQVEVNGVVRPTEFFGESGFSVTVAISIGGNALSLQGLDSFGQPIDNAVDSITVTGVPNCSIVSVSPSTVINNQTAQLTVNGEGFTTGSGTTVSLLNASDEIGFDALYVQGNRTIDFIDYAVAFLDDPTSGLAYDTAVHTKINLGAGGVFGGDEPFAMPYDTDFAVRFTGYIMDATGGIKYLGVNSDDGFRLSFDLNGDGDWTDAGELVGEYPDPRGPGTTMMSFNFTAGKTYLMALDFYERGGGEEVEFFQAGDMAGSNARLINDGSDIVVFRNDFREIKGTSVVVQDSKTIVFRANLSGIAPGAWSVAVTPPCGAAARRKANDVLRIVDAPVGTVDWTVSPATPAKSSGRRGGAFSPAQHKYYIQNMGTAALAWSVAKKAKADWLDLPAAAYGTVAGPGIAPPVTLTINATANTLAPGVYKCPVVFSVGCNPAVCSPTLEREVELVVTYQSDLNIDRSVNLRDLAGLAGRWLDTCSGPGWCDGADINANSRVDMADFGKMIDEWMLTVP